MTRRTHPAHDTTDLPVQGVTVVVEDSCRLCRFFLTDGPGRCRRFPPDPFHGFPQVGSTDWCGEFVLQVLR